MIDGMHEVPRGYNWTLFYSKVDIINFSPYSKY